MSTSKKICVSLHSMKAGGGVQERRAMLANEWSRLGYDVHVVAPGFSSGPSVQFSKEVSVHNLGHWPARTRNYVRKASKPLTNFFMEHRDFDAILAAMPGTIYVTTKALKRADLDTSLYGTVHGTLLRTGGLKNSMAATVGKLFLKRSRKRVRRFAGVCNAIENELDTLLSHPIQPITIYNPVVSSDSFVPNSRVERSSLAESTQKIVMGIGRLHHQKGFDLLIKLFADCNPDAKLVILGDGPLKPMLKEIAQNNGIGERVLFLGYKPNVLDYLQHADCFAFSSRWEGFGNVLVEALKVQLPIVSFDCPHGPREVLNQGQYGTLIECFCESDFAMAIDSALKLDRNENSRWQDFTVEKIAKEYLGFMELD